MAINPNNSRPLKHTCYCGASGAGKTTALKLLGMVGPQAVLFDPLGDYRASSLRKLSGLGNGRAVHHYSTRRGFALAFAEAWQSGKGFAIAYTPKAEQGDAMRAEALFFADLVWKASDGNRELHAVFEEVPRYSNNPVADKSILGAIASAGRKYGLIAHWVFQRPTQIPKTFIDDAAEYVVGAQQSMKDAKRWAEELDCPLSEIVELGKLNKPREKHYLHKKEGIGNYKKLVLTF